MKNDLIKNYFPGGNTPRGFYSFYTYLPHKAEEVFIIKGGPGTGKSTFMKDIAERGVKEGLEVELHWCSSDNNSLDGVVIPARKKAILDGTAPHMTDPVFPGAVEEILNFGEYWDKKRLQNYKDEIIELTKKISSNFEMVYFYLKMAEKPFSKEKNYIQKNLNQIKLQKTIKQLSNQIFNSSNKNKDKGKERHLFGTGITPEGHVNYLNQPNVTDTYLLEGPAGSGKTKIINQLGQKALMAGKDVLFLHCSFVPEEFDGIIINSNNGPSKIAVLDSSDPHKVSSDYTQIINTKDLLNQSYNYTSKKTREKLKQIHKEMFENAFYYLAKAKSNHDDLEEYYISAMDFAGIEKKKEELEKHIF